MTNGAITGEFIKELLSKGAREFGRGFNDYRRVVLSTGVIPHAEGSAECFIGNTRVLVGVKLAVSEPLPDKPHEGDIRTAAEMLPLASPDYEPGPPSPESIELARVVDRGIRAAGMIDTKSLFIEEGKVWSVFIDIYVLNFDGNLFDACTLAGVAALLDCRMPAYKDGKEDHENTVGKLKVTGMVTSSTFAKIGDKIVLDPDATEEKNAMDARVTVATDENLIRAMQKGGRGAFTAEEMDRIIQLTFEKSKDLRKIVKEAVGE